VIICVKLKHYTLKLPPIGLVIKSHQLL